QGRTDARDVLGGAGIDGRVGDFLVQGVALGEDRAAARERSVGARRGLNRGRERASGERYGDADRQYGERGEECDGGAAAHRGSLYRPTFALPRRADERTAKPRRRRERRPPAAPAAPRAAAG